MIVNIAILVYTNETNIPILKLFLKYFFKYNPSFSYSIYVTSNHFSNIELPFSDKVTYIDSEVEWDPQSKHFSQTLNKALFQIKEEYIFYFCEDYIMTNSIDILSLENLIKLIQNENIDMFSFASMYPKNHNFSLFDTNYKQYNFEENRFYTTDKNYLHAFSIQPCIWKKTSLQQLLISNPKIGLHDMDCSRLENKDQYKLICTDYKIHDGAYTPEYFILGYIEIIRHGAFLMELNGHSHLSGNYIDTFLKQLIKENNLHNKPEYDRYICFDKSLITW
jgi:hypothetical protein